MIFFEKPYYVVPADDLAEDAFIVLREALRRSKRIGLGQLTMRGREYVVSLKPCGKGMVLETLRYADEVNKASSYFREIEDRKPDDDLLDLAETLIEKKTAPFDAFMARAMPLAPAVNSAFMSTKSGQAEDRSNTSSPTIFPSRERPDSVKVTSFISLFLNRH